MEQLFELFRRLLNLTDTTYIRYLHDEIDWSVRMLGIVGPRGVGKTTMLLQHIKMVESIFILMKYTNTRIGLRN